MLKVGISCSLCSNCGVFMAVIMAMMLKGTSFQISGVLIHNVSVLSVS